MQRRPRPQGKERMYKGLSVVGLVACCLLASPASCPAQAQTNAPAQAAPAQPAVSGSAAARSDAAEARYRAWVEREHARDAASFAQEKTKIEDKYKGYVRPPREKKDAKTKTAAPQKDN